MNYSPKPQDLIAYDTPLSPIEQSLLTQRARIEAWFEAQWQKTPAPFYCSVDVRHAGFKLAPVDTNLFPAGFNNLHRTAYPFIMQAIQSTLSKRVPGAKKLLLIPENHTRNRFYLENLASLVELLAGAGFSVQIGSLLPDLHEPKRIDLESGRHVLLKPVQREGDKVLVEGFMPDVILSNNDFSSGEPDPLKAIAQPVLPPFGLGWESRLKSLHFRYYDMIVQSFAKTFSVDAWQLMPLFRHCGAVDFLKREGEDCLLRNSNRLHQLITQKYAAYEIETPPFMVVKADQGTYGMAVMMIEHAEEIVQLNRKRRTRMAAIKGGRSVSQVIIQEGVPSIETWQKGEKPGRAEMVVYLIGEKVIGAFYRVHPERGPTDNLNTPGMYFVPLEADPQAPESRAHDHFYAYTVVARLAQLAAAHELQMHQNQTGQQAGAS